MAVQVRLPGSGKRKFEAEIVTLPATVKVPSPPTQRFGGLFMGLVFTIIGYVMFRTGLLQDGFNLLTLFGLGWGSFGGLTLAKTLFSPKGQTVMVFDDDLVQVKTQGWLKSTHWQEPLKTYEGVRLRSKETPSRQASAPYQIIELIHKEKAKTLPLYAARSDDAPVDHLEHYADVLDVEVIK